MREQRGQLMQLTQSNNSIKVSIAVYQKQVVGAWIVKRQRCRVSKPLEATWVAQGIYDNVIIQKWRTSQQFDVSSPNTVLWHVGRTQIFAHMLIEIGLQAVDGLHVLRHKIAYSLMLALKTLDNVSTKETVSISFGAVHHTTGCIRKSPAGRTGTSYTLKPCVVANSRRCSLEWVEKLHNLVRDFHFQRSVSFVDDNFTSFQIILEVWRIHDLFQCFTRIRIIQSKHTSAKSFCYNGRPGASGFQFITLSGAPTFSDFYNLWRYRNATAEIKNNKGRPVQWRILCHQRHNGVHCASCQTGISAASVLRAD